MAPHSSTLAWKIPWMEEPGRLQSTGSWRVGHDWMTSLSLFTFMHCRRKWQPTPVFLPGESQGWRSLVGCRLWGPNRVRHDWSDLAEAAAATFHCVYVPQLSYPFICRWTSRLLACPGYCKQCCGEHWGTCVSFNSGFLGVYAQQWDCWVIRQFYFQFFRESPHCSP